MRTTAVVVVYDVACAKCSRIARELPDLLRVPVTVRSCRDPRLALVYPTLRQDVRACATPAMGTGMRTFSPSALPHLGLAAAVLVVPFPAALVLGAGFAGGRLAMPLMSNAWSDDGAWTAVWARAEPAVRPVLALTCAGALFGAMLLP